MDYLDRVFLGNTIRSYLLVLGIIVFVLLVKRFLSHYIARLLFRLVRRAFASVEKKQFVELIIKPLGWFITIVAAIMAIDKLNFPDEWQFKIYRLPFDVILDRLGLVLLIISFTWLVLRTIDFTSIILEQKASLTKDKRDDQIIVFFRDFLKVILSIAGILFIIRVGFNQNIGSILTGLSIVGAALALAAKESIENLIASFIIFFDKPFITGDTLKVQSVTGMVEHIGLRSTRIRTTEKTLVTVPNKQMVDSIVDNWSMRTQRRAEIKLEFVVSTETSKMELLIGETKKIISAHQHDIIKSSVFLTEFNKNGITVVIEYFTQPFTMSEFNQLKQAFNISLKKIIEDHKLELVSGGSGINIYTSDGGQEPPRVQPII